MSTITKNITKTEAELRQSDLEINHKWTGSVPELKNNRSRTDPELN